MCKYYRYYQSERIYRILFTALNENKPAEKVIVYQAMYDDGVIWTCPESEFFGNVLSDNGTEVARFMAIPEEVALKEIPLYLNPKYHFPDIHYTSSIPRLSRRWNNSFSPSVLRMISLMKNVGVMNDSMLDGVYTDDDIEHKIVSLISSYRAGDDLALIFHLIEAWGGISGRAVYNRGEGRTPVIIIREYAILVSSCLSMTTVDDRSMDQLISAIRRFVINIKYMSVAFVTKHTHFWLTKNHGENALPIYDSVMSRTVMRTPLPKEHDLKRYWRVMISKAEHLGISLSALERQVFISASTNKM